MTEDIKEFDKLIREKKISDVDKMLEESKKLTEKIPDLKERHEKVVIARGNVIEASIKVEMAFDELITKTGGEDLVLDHEKKEFHLITGIKKEEEIKRLRFDDKIKLVREIVKKVLNESPELSEPNLLNDLDRFRAIRNIFAHVPVSWFAKELEFDDNPHYKHFFKMDPNWKKISFAVTEFMNLQKAILELIPIYIKSVVLKREIFSNILLGKNFNDIIEDYNKEKNDDEKESN
tara:strand:+ start:251 stop:952 length:702 start_codon:yes stop_codon:yes gene_type:complete